MKHGDQQVDSHAYSAYDVIKAIPKRAGIGGTIAEIHIWRRM